jgi:hypothetical protein
VFPGGEEKVKDIRYYSLKRFLRDDEYTPQCVLLRRTKVVRLRPRDILPVESIAPYVRSCETLEFCDNFLFKNKKPRDVAFLGDVMSLAPGLKRVALHYDRSSIDPYIKKNSEEFVTRCASSRPGVTIDPRQYESWRGNHDRFILADRDRWSIRFTTSFNNLSPEAERKYCVEDDFDMIFVKGREYHD